jgi:farnesyl diphosphate synthase
VSSFSSQLESVAAESEALLDQLLAPAPMPGEIARPARLLDAMRYAMLGGGKRLRPFLAVASADLFGVARAQALLAGAAIECVHGYSLVHDDLPAMDNDDLRRGQPTTHRKFDEATAILAGDALLTLAFDLASRRELSDDPHVRIAFTSGLARASGIGGMAGGQMLDLAAEGRFGTKGRMNLAAIEQMQAMKTGALLHFSCAAGAILGGADKTQRAALDAYGFAVGKAFQIADDLLDIEGDAATVGKQTGKDAAAGKATFASELGVSGARDKLKELVATAEAALSPFGAKADVLKATARFIAERRT